MTREDAIKILNPATSFDALLGMDREEGIKVVEEACLLAVADIEKQIPKKPKREVYFYGSIDHCPVCNKLFRDRPDYCPKCGQALSWSEEGE